MNSAFKISNMSGKKKNSEMFFVEEKVRANTTPFLRGRREWGVV